MDIIIGIDPGSRVTGYGLVRCYPDRLEHLGHGCIRVDHLGQSARLLEKIGFSIAPAVAKLMADLVLERRNRIPPELSVPDKAEA